MAEPDGAAAVTAARGADRKAYGNSSVMPAVTVYDVSPR